MTTTNQARAKSTYRLFGLLWDWHPLPRKKYPFRNDCKGVRDCSCDFDLFDTVKYRRKIKISVLFKINTAEELDILVRNVQGCHEIIVELDLVPQNTGTVLRDFVKHRSLQMLDELSRRLPESNIKIYCQKKSWYKTLMKDISGF